MEDQVSKKNHDMSRFETTMLPHLDAAFNLARWLTGNDHDAEDLVQESYLRAFRFFDRYREGDGRAWLLKIVRNTCYSWLKKNRMQRLATEFDEELHSESNEALSSEMNVLRNSDKELLNKMLEEMPAEFREMIIMHDLEGLSYKEMAEIAEVPIGTVMSRLARARERLQRSLASHLKKKGCAT
jgi:RNA polymerase sigma factor (sigma-70 family)